MGSACEMTEDSGYPAAGLLAIAPARDDEKETFSRQSAPLGYVRAASPSAMADDELCQAVGASRGKRKRAWRERLTPSSWPWETSTCRSFPAHAPFRSVPSLIKGSGLIRLGVSFGEQG
jgi:hypothetical protein